MENSPQNIRGYTDIFTVQSLSLSLSLLLYPSAYNYYY